MNRYSLLVDQNGKFGYNNDFLKFSVMVVVNRFWHKTNKQIHIYSYKNIRIHNTVYTHITRSICNDQ